MIPWNERNPPMKKPSEFGFDRDAEQGSVENWYAVDAWYTYLINEWVHEQKDSDDLMRVFIGEANFDPLKFVQILKGHTHDCRGNVVPSTTEAGRDQDDRVLSDVAVREPECGTRHHEERTTGQDGLMRG